MMNTKIPGYTEAIKQENQIHEKDQLIIGNKGKGFNSKLLNLIGQQAINEQSPINIQENSNIDLQKYVDIIEKRYNLKVQFQNKFSKKQGVFFYREEKVIGQIFQTIFDDKEGFETNKHLYKKISSNEKGKGLMNELWNLYHLWCKENGEECPNSDVTQKISVISWYRKHNFFPTKKIIKGKCILLSENDRKELEQITEEYKMNKQEVKLPFAIQVEKIPSR